MHVEKKEALSVDFIKAMMCVICFLAVFPDYLNTQMYLFQVWVGGVEEGGGGAEQRSLNNILCQNHTVSQRRASGGTPSFAA